MPTKRYYRIQEVSELLAVPATTLRFWEQEFPMFNPNRLPSGQRRYTSVDIKTAKYIKELLYVKGMKLEGAVEYMNMVYRKYPPRKLRTCKTPEDAIMLLDEVKEILEDAHAIKKIESVEKWIKGVRNVKK